MPNKMSEPDPFGVRAFVPVTQRCWGGRVIWKMRLISIASAAANNANGGGAVLRCREGMSFADNTINYESWKSVLQRFNHR